MYGYGYGYGGSNFNNFHGQGSGNYSRGGQRRWRGNGDGGNNSWDRDGRNERGNRNRSGTNAGTMGAFESSTRPSKSELQRPPANLKGRALGLFYRDRTKKGQGPQKLELPNELLCKIAKMLDSLDDFNNDSSNESSSSFSFKREYLDIISVSFLEKLTQSLQINYKNRPLDKVNEWNEKLHTEYMQKLDNDQYNKMLEFRKNLPAYQKRSDILKCIRENQVCVISGETGCGKTTQVGQLILEEACIAGVGGKVNVLITQPRRVAATSVANRIAEERAEQLGITVGYTIRLESSVPRRYGSIELVTTGVLLQRLQSDPGLLSISHLILDEVHERDSLCDMVIGITKQIISKRNDLKVILMSATIDADRFCQYFGGCPLLHIPGLMFPVKEFYLEDALELTKFNDFDYPGYSNNYKFRGNTVKHFEEERKKFEYSKFIKPYIHTLQMEGKYSESTLDTLRDPQCEELCHDFVAAVVRELARGPKGGILVFLPGFADISKVCTILERSYMPPCLILPLHSRLNSSDQQAIFRTPPEGVRKIIVSTNIAETSITIDDIVYVVDCGKIKMTDYDVAQDMSTLKAEWVSKANAHQRRGRAGRVQAGECWRLYSKVRSDSLIERPAPELLRAPLHEPLLSALLLRLGPAPAFLQTLLDPPSPLAVEAAVKLLHRMRILDENGRLTPLGVHVARLPVAPGAARMLLLAALMSATAPAAAIAAVIAFRDPFLLPIGKEREVEERKRILSKGLCSDQLTAVEAQKQWLSLQGQSARTFCEKNFLSWRTLEMLKDMRNQFTQLLYNARFLNSSDPDADDANIHSSNQSLLKALIVAGLYPNVASYKNQYVLKTDEGSAKLHPSSVNIRKAPPAARIVYHLKQESSSVFLHDTSPAHALPLLFFGDSYNIIPDGKSETVFVEVGGGRWRTSPETAQLLGRMRDALDNLLKYKLENPGPVDWDSSEGTLLTAIIYLITAEDNPGALENNQNDSD